MKITIEKIAEMAGVSRGAVDKVLHNRPGVKEPVRQRIQQVIRQTGYVPLHGTPEPTTKVIGVIMPRISNPYFAAVKRGMECACRTMKELTLVYAFCEPSDVNGILAALDAFEQQGVHAYLLRGVRSSKVRDRLRQVQKPIVFIDSEVPGVPALCKVGEDCYKSGRIAASLLAKSIGYVGQVVVIGGSPEIVAHEKRIEGFLDAVSERYPQIQVVDRLYSQDQSVVAYERACKTLDEFPHLKGIGNLAGYAGEIGQAILERNRERTVKMVCYDITPDIAALIHKNVIEFTIGLEPYQQAQMLMETVYDALMLGTHPSVDFLETPIAVAFDETVDAMLKKMEQ